MTPEAVAGMAECHVSTVHRAIRQRKLEARKVSNPRGGLAYEIPRAAGLAWADWYRAADHTPGPPRQIAWKRPRAKCPRCGRKTAVNKGGKMHTHQVPGQRELCVA